MKLKHNLAFPITKLISKIAENEYISDKTKDLLFFELDEAYSNILSMKDSDRLDITDIKPFIMEHVLIPDSEKETIYNLCFTEMIKEEELQPYVKELNFSEAAKAYKKIKDRLPIFFIYSGGDNIVSRSIRLFTRSDFSHVSISTSSLDEIISFGTTKQNYGLVVENWFDFCNIRKPKNIGVHFIDVPFEEYKKIKNTIEFHKAHNNEYYYSFKKLFTIPFKPVMNYKDEEGKAFICSEFIYYLVNGTSITDHVSEDRKNALLISPKEFRDKILNKSTIIYEGDINNFNTASVNAVYNLYDDSALSKKKQIDAEIHKQYEIKPERAKNKLKQLKIKLNK